MSTYNSPPPYQENQPAISPSSIPLSAIKALELRFQAKGLLPAINEEEIHPVWFMALKEKDRFLWRRGLSLADEAAFVFWIDVYTLINLRLQDIKAADAVTELHTLEQQYLEAFLDAYYKIYRHVHAFSRANIVLEEEIHPELANRDAVMLPERSKRPA